MFALKVITLLVLTTVATASDLQRGLELMACAKDAITVGVPELGVPTHEPFVTLKTTFNWTGLNFLDFTNASLQINNMTWAGIARWNLSATQLSYDTDSNASFDWKLYWEWMELKGHYKMTEKVGFVTLHQEGNFAIELNETSWFGNISLSKMGATPSDKNGTINDLNIKWHVKKVGVTITGLPGHSLVEASMETGIKHALNNDLIGNAVGDFMKMRLKTIWWDTGKVWDLYNWCAANNYFE